MLNPINTPDYPLTHTLFIMVTCKPAPPHPHDPYDVIITRARACVKKLQYLAMSFTTIIRLSRLFLECFC